MATKGKIQVVIRFIPTFQKYYICHAQSYQNVFRSLSFEERHLAIAYAEKHGCDVVFHEGDQLQAIYKLLN